MVKKPKRKIDKELLARVRAKDCAVCGKGAPSDPSHIRSRGAGGPDEEFNVLPMCRSCHGAWHSFGAMKFLERHPKFKWTLDLWGWEVGNGLWHPKLGEREVIEKPFRDRGPIPA